MNDKFTQVVGFGDYLVFSDMDYDSTRGKVIVFYDDKQVTHVKGGSNKYIGEHIFISRDSPGGNIVLGVSMKNPTDSFDHITLYKILPN